MVAPLSPLLVSRVGTRLTVAAGLLVIAVGLWQVSDASVTSTYADVLAGMTMLGSLGAAQEVAARLGGAAGDTLVHLARVAFVDGMDLGLLTGAAVAAAAAVLALVALPRRGRTR